MGHIGHNNSATGQLQQQQLHTGLNSTMNTCVAPTAPYEDLNAATGMFGPACTAPAGLPLSAVGCDASAAAVNNSMPMGIGVVCALPTQLQQQQSMLPMLPNHMTMTGAELNASTMLQQLQQPQQPSALHSQLPPVLEQHLQHVTNTALSPTPQAVATQLQQPNTNLTAAYAAATTTSTTTSTSAPLPPGSISSTPPSSSSNSSTAMAPVSQAPSSSSSPSSSSMCSLNNALGSADDSAAILATEYASAYNAPHAQPQPQQQQPPQHQLQAPSTPTPASDDELSRSAVANAAAAEAAAATLSYNEAREKQRQEKKERHATKKLIKELAVCKAILEGMEVR